MARQDTNGSANGSGGGPGSRSASNSAFARTSFLYGGNIAYVERLQDSYLRDPASLDPSWREFFTQMNDASDTIARDRARATMEATRLAGRRRRRTRFGARGNWAGSRDADRRQARGEGRRGRSAFPRRSRYATRDSVRALMMIRAYRIRGHLHANLDPLGIRPRRSRGVASGRLWVHGGRLQPEYFIDGVLGLQFATIPEMLKILRRTYCGTIGFEFMHISDPAEKGWLQRRIEGPGKEITFTKEGKRAILNKLVEAEGFEQFLDIKYTGTKRFGLDGGEAMIPALEQIIKRGGALGVQDIVLGMAHRGRLNVLSQVMGKPHKAIFNEFKGGSFTPDAVAGSGDVEISSWRLIRPRL